MSSEKREKTEDLEQKNIKITIRLSESSMNKCTEGMALSGCRVRNDFIERSIEFYSGYLAAKSHTEYLSSILLEAINGSVASTESRLARMLFKVAVELAKLEHMLATVNDMDEETMARLHARCTQDVKRINGILRMEDAVEFQRSDF